MGTCSRTNSGSVVKPAEVLIKTAITFAVLFFACGKWATAQSLEIMAGGEYVFADLQWLKPFDQQHRWTLFSRTRATVGYDNRANFFSGAYLNFTTEQGIGGSVIGKISQTNGAGVDAGVHIFKPKTKWMLFGLLSMGLKEELEYSWFSIFRFTPDLKGNWKWYSSLELFHIFDKNGHAFSVERLRLGVDWKGYQFGVAGNFQQVGTGFQSSKNLGGFLRKAF